MLLRIANAGDINVIIELVSALIDETKFKYLFPDKKFLEQAAAIFTKQETLNQRICVLLEEEGEIIGLGAFEIIPCLYTDKYMARLVCVYIKPEHRDKGGMDEILYAFELWGKQTGVKHFNIGVTTDADLTKRGYEKYEVMYMKEIE